MEEEIYDSQPPKIFLLGSDDSREKREKINDSYIYVNNPIMPDIEEIAERDKKILQIRDLLQKNKEELRLNNMLIEKESKNNSYLKDVLNNYHSYRNYIVNMKNKQKDSMDNIFVHLEKIANENTLSEENLERIKMEQNHILEELDNLKKDLKELTLKDEK